jgi:hypothetical protein
MDGGRWDHACFLTGQVDPIGKRNSAAPESQIAAIAGYVSAVRKLKSNLGTNIAHNHEVELEPLPSQGDEAPAYVITESESKGREGVVTRQKSVSNTLPVTLAAGSFCKGDARQTVSVHKRLSDAVSIDTPDRKPSPFEFKNFNIPIPSVHAAHLKVDSPQAASRLWAQLAVGGPRGGFLWDIFRPRGPRLHAYSNTSVNAAKVLLLRKVAAAIPNFPM